MATSPLTDQTTRNDYVATAAQTTFPYTFWIKEQDHIDIYVNGTLKTLTTDYTISAVQSVTGANVVFNSGLTLNDEVAIVYNPDIERATDFSTGGSLRASALNLEFTYGLSLLQFLKTQVSRTVTFGAATDTSGVSAELPTPTADRIIGWNSAGDALQNYATADFIGPTGPTGPAGDAIKVSSNDTTPSDLETKLLVGAGLSLSTQNDGANETRTIDLGLSSLSTATPTLTDTAIFTDVSDSNATKKATIGDILGLVTTPDASTTVKGIVELATNAETQTGTDTARAVTPAGLQSKVASETALGLVKAATTSEMNAGTSGKYPDASKVKTYVDANSYTPPTTVAAVGTFGFMYCASAVTVGTDVAGASLFYSDSDNTVGGTPGVGTWRAFGTASAGSATLYLRIS